MNRFLLCATVLAMLGGCTTDLSEKQSVDPSPDRQGPAVVFSVVTNETRTDAAELDEFFVEGHLLTTPAARALDFISTTVRKRGEAWSYSPAVYFPVDGHGVSFYAYSPVEDRSRGELVVDNNVVSFDYELVGEQDIRDAADLMVGSAVGQTSARVTTELVMRRALSSVVMRAANVEKDTTCIYKVSRVRLLGLDTRGNFTYPLGDDSWRVSGKGEGEYVAPLVPGGVKLSIGKDGWRLDSLLAPGISLVVLPQYASEHVQIEFTYDLDRGRTNIFKERVRTLSLAEPMTFAAGGEYNFEFMFTGAGEVDYFVAPEPEEEKPEKPEEEEEDNDGPTTIEDVDWKISSGGAMLLSAEDDDRPIVITPEIVAQLPSYAVQLTLGSGVKEIAANAFENMPRLQSVTVGASVDVIRAYAFSNCPQLRRVVMESPAPSTRQFTWTRAVTNISNGTKAIEDFAFFGDTNLTEVRLPNSLKTIGVSSFEGCTALATINIPNGITSVGDYAFKDCVSLKGIDLSHTLASIGKGAFEGCTGLTEIEIPRNIKEIEEGTFAGCDNLERVVIPNGVTTIGPGAFEGCESLTDIEFPSTITEIGEGAFDGCDNLDLAALPEYIQDLMPFKAGNWGGLKWKVSNSGVLTLTGSGSMPDLTGAAPWAGEPVTGVVVGEGVTSVGAGAFAGLAGVTSVVLPSTVTSIGAGAFKGCSVLAGVELPAGLTTIGAEAFLGCANLAAVNFPASLVDIGERAFEGTKVTLPAEWQVVAGGTAGALLWKLDAAGVLTVWGEGAMPDYEDLGEDHRSTAPWNEFRGDIKKVVLKPGVTTIGDCAFLFVGWLTQVVVPEGVISIGESAFRGSNRLFDIVLPRSLRRIEDNAFSGCFNESREGDKRLTIPGGVEFIGESAFNEAGITHLTFEEGVTTIGFGAFTNIYRLVELNLPASLRTIDRKAFGHLTTSIKVVSRAAEPPEWGIESLSQYGAELVLHIPASSADAYRNSEWSEIFPKAYDLNGNLLWDIVERGRAGALDWMFSSDGTLTVFGNGPMPDYDFNFSTLSNTAPWRNHLGQIKKIVIKPGVGTIGAGAFFTCDNLAELSLPQGLTSIGNSAFAGSYEGRLSTSPLRVTIPGTVETMDYSAFGASNLTSLTVEEGKLSELSLGTAYSVSELTLPNSVKRLTISYLGLSELTLPNSLEYLNINNCRYLESIVIPQNVVQLSNSGFRNCYSLTRITSHMPVPPPIDGDINSFHVDNPQAVLYIPAAYANAYRDGTWGEIFSKAYDLNGNLLWDNGEKKSSGTLGGNVAWELSGGSLTISGTGAIPSKYTNGSSNPNWPGDPISTVDIKQGITSIGASAFYYLSSLKEVVIPEGVISIGESAFKFCTMLTDLVLPQSLERIETGAFASSFQLWDSDQQSYNRRFVIPSGVKYIGTGALAYTNLTEIVCLAPVPPEFGGGLVGIDDNDAPILRVPAASVAKYKADAVWSAAFTSIVAIQ